MDETLQQAAEAIHNAKSVVALTGAGVSVESGVPDFRSAGGIWDLYPPEEFATIDAFQANPDKVWGMWYELGDMLAGAKPNPGHAALAELEKMGQLTAVITQNIDNLHTEAGNTNVIEYHGNARWIVCPACRRRRALEHEQRTAGAPRCECGGAMKPDVVLFGEMIPPNALIQSESHARSCDVLLVLGTSATVYPAAGIPYIAKKSGAYLIECNTERTEFTSTVTDVFLQGPAGQVLPQLVALLKQNP